jgi:CheY-like chemotaxis protein
MRKRILILDDSPLALDVSQQALEAAGFDVSTALNLEQLEKLRATLPPDLILIDVQMPEAFGDDVAMAIRRTRQDRVPLVLFSNLEPADLARRAKGAGADGFISKRDGLQRMVDQVKALVGGA